jgi:hypothetical protein
MKIIAENAADQFVEIEEYYPDQDARQTHKYPESKDAKDGKFVILSFDLPGEKDLWTVKFTPDPTYGMKAWAIHVPSPVEVRTYKVGSSTPEKVIKIT